MMKVNLFTINSKRLAAAVLATGVFLLAGCGQADQVKTISKEAKAEESVEAVADNEEVTEGQEAAADQAETVSTLDGYYFEIDGNSITTDIDMEPVLSALGEPNQYYEAASCAFNGLDKFYTYDHYEIDTYPDGNKDYISSIVLIDDLVSTPEGIALGSTKDDVEAAFGDDFEKNGSAYIYTKGTTHLSLVFDGDSVISISYDTTKLDD